VSVAVLERALRKHSGQGHGHVPRRPGGQSAIETLAGRVGVALREALSRPMLYRDRALRARGRWLLISRGGLVVEAALHTHGLEVEGLWWPLGPMARLYAEPWREVARRLLFPQMQLIEGNIVHDDRGAEFVTPEAWGLHREGPNLVWAGTFPPWPDPRNP